MRFPFILFFVVFGAFSAYGADAPKFDYRVLATSKTSTMEKELNEAADAGCVFSSVMGGETAFGGKEVLSVMVKRSDKTEDRPRHYKLLATTKTSTLQKELQEGR
jgi:hypothetical protein